MNGAPTIVQAASDVVGRMTGLLLTAAYRGTSTKGLQSHSGDVRTLGV
jgi:hypothetical protein